ncbi:MAG: right-handed parallel beta-helix repeat-containing protein [Chitinophagaceae bacterium]
MKAKKLYTCLLFIGCCMLAKANNYYINAATGSDDNKGNNQGNPLKSIQALNKINFSAGDSIFFASGQEFSGMLNLENVKGTANAPIVVTKYMFKNNASNPIIDAGEALQAILIENSSFIKVMHLEITGKVPYNNPSVDKKEAMRCGILVKVSKDADYEQIILSNIKVHNVFFYPPGFTRTAAETKSANGTQSYGWGIRFINNTKFGKLNHIEVSHTEISKVSHTGLKFTATKNGINNIVVANCKVFQTGGPGMQFSGVTNAHIHHNSIDHSGSIEDTRNWGRGSGLWTWGCSNFVIEHNRFENANGPGDSAGIHIDFNCNDIVVQYNFSANNAGGFCEILGNNYNCAYRYNISVNDGYRVKGEYGAFQEGKIFWLSGYQGNQKKNAGPYNSYFYNNTMYVSADITPKMAVSSSTSGMLVANNIFYFEKRAQMVSGDQKKVEIDDENYANAIVENNLFLHKNNWPDELPLQNKQATIGDAAFAKKGGLALIDYLPTNKKLVVNKGIVIKPIPNDTIGLKIGLQVEKDILGNAINGLPDMGAIEIPQ